MRIAFDATSMPERRAGAGRLMYELGHALADHAAEHPLLLLERFEAFRDVAGRPGVSVRRVRAGGRILRFGWEQSLLPGIVRRWRADVLHGAHHALPLLPAATAAVTTVHDVTFDVLPRRYTPARRWYMKAITRLGLLRADRVIVSSTWVRDALVRRYGVRAERVHVVPQAPALGMARIEDRATLHRVRETYDLPPRFLLSVGTREPGKNRGVLVRALDELAGRGLALPLVVVGQRGWLDPEAHTEHPGADVRHTGYVPDADLPALYTLAEALLFPSLLEGFGLPPLEAMACGTPVIVSDRPAMPEVLGDAALYADPRRPEAWASQIERLILDGSLWEEMRRRGTERARLYSWERAARETIAVYRAALEGSREQGLTSRIG